MDRWFGYLCELFIVNLLELDRVAFKPVATLLREQPTVDKDGRETTLQAKGRHDPCVLPRAVPVVEAMAAMTILDAYLMNKTVKL